MGDCRTCKFNIYRKSSDVRDDWFDCNHPVTLERGPHWEKGDPAMVNWRTADVNMRDIEQFKDCPTFVEAQGE